MTQVHRRTLLQAGLVAGAAVPVFGRSGPAFAASRPALTHGVQSGDATADSAIVWTRADRPSRMWVTVSDTPSFRRSRLVRGPVLTPDTDFTGKVRIPGLVPGARTYYRVHAEDLDSGTKSEPLTGSLRTAPVRADTIRFTWSGDVAGQGWGIDPAYGGMRSFAAMRALRPDFFLHSGDTVYADGPLAETVTLPDGRVWHNIVTPAKSKVAETLDEYRGQFAYNLLDENLRAFAAEVPQVNQWDDHEVHNNWYPGQILADTRYAERRVDVLMARARQAYHEWVPVPGAVTDSEGRIYRKLSYGPLLDLFVLDMRTCKDPNGPNVYTDPTIGLLGTEQRQWLIRELTASSAAWKVIANDLPLGLVVPDGPGRNEAVAQGDNGAPLGRELEFAEVLRTADRRGVTGIVFLTADVHYTAAHRYDPARAAIGDFTPFWEFVSGPLHAGVAGKPNQLDGTFGPELVFAATSPRSFTGPADGHQHFGEVEIDGGSGAMTVRLRDQDNTVLWSTTLPAAGRTG